MSYPGASEEVNSIQIFTLNQFIQKITFQYPIEH